MVLSQRRVEKLAKTLLWLSAGVTIFILMAIIGYIFFKGMKGISWEFLTQESRRMGSEGGIFPFIVTTLYLIILSIGIATPVGIGAAVFLTEYAKENKLTKFIRFGIESLAGIPSVIFGLFGFAFFVIYLKLSWSLWSGGITVALMILPTIIRTAEEALKTVPRSYREGSLALGATKWQTIYKVVLPSALSGIITGVILGVGRVVGETAALILTLGGSIWMPQSLSDAGRTLSMHLYLLATEIGDMDRAYATATVLIIVIFAINTGATFLIQRIVAKHS